MAGRGMKPVNPTSNKKHHITSEFYKEKCIKTQRMFISIVLTIRTNNIDNYYCDQRSKLANVHIGRCQKD